MTAGIDRGALLRRHSPHYRAADARAPLSVGNGEFCFTADVTGLQTFPEAYRVAGDADSPAGTLLGTMSSWAWHSSPDGPYELAGSLSQYDSPHGRVPYVDLPGAASIHDQRGADRPAEWLRNNPHRIDLGRLGLWLPGPAIDLDAVQEIDQRLNLASGVLSSAFTLRGRRLRVQTAAHPHRDAVAFDIRADDDEPLGIRLRFPYGSEAWGNAADWSSPSAHQTAVEREQAGWTIRRRLDETTYGVRLTVRDAELRRLDEHELVLQGRRRLAVTVEFIPGHEDTPPRDPAEVAADSERGWAAFWQTGAVVDLSASDDPRSAELERRIVLSQYLTAIQCSGTLPPAETGLTLNSWRGKFHLEMHWWHAAHFALWGRPQLIERSLGWYERVLPSARATAAEQGLSGARWPKQVGPDGREAPSSIGPFLLWQQPHLIHFAELCYRAAPSRATLERWAPLVWETAEFLAAFPAPGPRGIELGPPLIPAQESYAADRATNRNPTFELAYWQWALRTAAAWKERLGLATPTAWLVTAGALVAPAVGRGGGYLALDPPSETVREDHPSMLAAFGLVPSTPLIDRATMDRTLRDVLSAWDWDSAWGWDFPMIAMTATRLQRPGLAVDALLADRPKNTYLANGHNRQTDQLPLYLPGNGGLLTAVAIMAAGWDGSADAPGFGPGWHVAHEGLVQAPA